MKLSRKAMIVGLAIALLALPLITMVRAHYAPPTLPIYGTLAPFSLTDQNGARFDSTSLAGHVWVADFIFTRCTMVCPRLTADMAKVQTHLVNRGLDRNVRIVSFSVDPDNDTPAVLKTYGAHFGARDDVWSFLTGPEKEIERTIVDGFKTAMSHGNGNVAENRASNARWGEAREAVPNEGGRERPPVVPGNGNDFDIVHGSKFVLVDSHARIRGYYDSTDPADVANLLQHIEQLTP